MSLIKKRKVLDGVYWVEIPKVNLFILCGCPADSIKHLFKMGLVQNIEHKGVQYQTGPNAILLSDLLFQEGELSNLSEFPILHMFYNQGMILPKHPNNTGNHPYLIGSEEQVSAQMNYIFRGNYGLVSEKEYKKTKVTEDFIRENMRVKLKFAFGRFTPSEEMINGIPVSDHITEIKDGVTIQRKKINVFEISFQGKSVVVDLNLKKYRKYKPTYQLPNIKLKKPYFGIVHTGEGNGWDPKRPCVGSVVIFNGKIFLIDTGPNIVQTLKALKIKIKEIEGIFFTHVHDDHFAGLYSIISKNTKIKIFATAVVQSTLEKKLAALLMKKQSEVKSLFQYHELKLDQWNDYQNMLIKPLLSPHAIDTTIFVFKVRGNDRDYTYGHFSDIAAISWLENMLVKQSGDNGISIEYLNYVKECFALKLDVKKVDVGGPAIHGDEEDFLDDPSNKLVLAHTTQPLNKRQLEIGKQAEFGELDILIENPPDEN
jgi:hemerythrin